MTSANLRPLPATHQLRSQWIQVNPPRGPNPYPHFIHQFQHLLWLNWRDLLGLQVLLKLAPLFSLLPVSQTVEEGKPLFIEDLHFILVELENMNSLVIRGRDQDLVPNKKSLILLLPQSNDWAPPQLHHLLRNWAHLIIEPFNYYWFHRSESEFVQPSHSPLLQLPSLALAQVILSMIEPFQYLKVPQISASRSFHPQQKCYLMVDHHMKESIIDYSL